MIGCLFEQIIKAVVVDFHLQFFVDGIGHVGGDAGPQCIAIQLTRLVHSGCSNFGVAVGPSLRDGDRARCTGAGPSQIRRGARCAGR
jgi:hypothetical protein